MSELEVLCVDPDEARREATREGLGETAEVDTVGCGSVAEAMAELTSGDIDCLVTAYELPDGTGLDLAARVRDERPDTPCILFTDHSPADIRTERREDVVVEYLPRDMPEVYSALGRLVRNVVERRTQVAYPLPDAEEERLAALRQYDLPGLETAKTFDRLTALAKRHFDVDVAFVGLVDAHEERFIACQGEEWETLEREDTICTHTILEDDVLLVEDVKADPRFADNDRLDDLNIRAYAGATLTTPRGAAIGAFCLTHSEVRTFTADDEADLRRFADEAMEQLELRRRLHEASEADLLEAGGANGGTDE